GGNFNALNQVFNKPPFYLHLQRRGVSMPFQTTNLTRCAFLAIISAVLTACTPEYADFQGKVTRVVDGDTIDVLVNSGTIRVRLADIDAPENGQAFGQRARQHLSELLFRRKVRVIEKQTDDYGRTLGLVYAQQCAPVNTCIEHNVNALMVHA